MQVLTKSKQFIKGATVAGSVAALLIAPGAAFAHGGGDNGNKESRRDNRSSKQQSNRSHVTQRQQDKQSQKSKSWWQSKQNRDRQDRHKTCEERQAGLNQKADAARKKYTERLNGLNVIYTGTQAFVENGGATVENYEALKTQAGTSQANATAAVNAIAAPQLNCDGTEDQSQADASNGSANTTLNQNIQAAKDAVKVYGRDVMTLFRTAINVE
jgi:hypothetical protein